MLRLPLKSGLRCGCYPILLLVIVALLFLTVGRTCIRKAGPAPTATAGSLPPAAAVTPTMASTSTSPPMPTWTPVPAATQTPLPTPTPVVPTATATWTATPTPTPNPTQTPTVTPSPTPTDTPTQTPTPTRAPTQTPTPTRAPTETPTPTRAAVGEALCDAPIQTAIEGAMEAQAQYMEGTLSAEALYDAWGEAAVYAQEQADQMIAYRDDAVQRVEIVDVTWELLSCAVEREGDRVRVAAGERWTYTAQVDCTSGSKRTSSWVDAFPAEEYYLVLGAEGWRIRSWRTGPVQIEARWTCP
jgi:outer membrane biosynthesis protein TonB